MNSHLRLFQFLFPSILAVILALNVMLLSFSVGGVFVYTGILLFIMTLISIALWYRDTEISVRRNGNRVYILSHEGGWRFSWKGLSLLGFKAQH